MDETVRILLDLQSGNNIFPYVMQKVDFFRGNYLGNCTTAFQSSPGMGAGRNQTLTT